MGRATQGVRLINLKEADSIASVVSIAISEEEDVILQNDAEENVSESDENGKVFED
jgi:DNA gyrase subunit A